MPVARASSRPAGPIFNVSAMYLLFYMAGGGYNPFINLYYSRLGLSGIEIGSLVSLGVLVGTVAAFMWAALADGLKLHNRILSLALLLSPIVVLLIGQANNYGTLIPLIAALALVSNPIGTLMDSAALEAVKLHHSSYGVIRTWGSVGWSVSSWLVGLLVERSGIHWIFNVYAILMWLTLILSFLVPKRTQVLRMSMWQGLQRLINRNTLIFLFSIFLISVTSSAAMSFFSIYLDHLGMSEGMIGLSWTFASLSEIPLMFFSGRLIRRVGAQRLLGVAFALYALRWALYSFVQTPVLVLLIQLLSGFSFALFLTSGVTYFNQNTPTGLTTTAQTLYNTVVFGISGIFGSMLGGFLFDLVGMQWLLRVVALLTLVAFAVFVLAPRAVPGKNVVLQPED